MELLNFTNAKSRVLMNVENFSMNISLSNKTKKNALDEDLYNALAEMIEVANTSPDVKCIFIQGDDGIFSIGNSLDGLTETQEKNRLGQCTRRFLRSLVENKKPLLALVDGAAIGIGATLLFHCDVVIATKRAFFHTPFVDLNVTPEAASSVLGPRQLGYRNAFKLLVLGDKWRATKALEYGLIDEVVDSYDDAITEINNVKTKIIRKPLNALMASRALVRLPVDDMNAAMCREIFEFERCISAAPA
ncbi:MULTISPECIES: enoyl-CoA hydratase-related protein [unclassified Lentilitoribacter]|jgi:enoyl-CoA hydratase/carnithine racemase|uniref:enoyl-CoA hydratase-related protein n=1 Tax=unclassified Lentilitoribacter TaxID=2647570 RepID=UPI0013A6FB87|nr:enoyl-CoA hydratase-related protein [Lentilitoribacter sp. Alg239-R112]